MSGDRVDHAEVVVVGSGAGGGLIADFRQTSDATLFDPCRPAKSGCQRQVTSRPEAWKKFCK